MSGFDVIAVLVAASGKADRLEEIIATCAKSVEAKESSVLKYHCQRETTGETPTFIMLETFKDQAAYESHNNTDHFQQLVKDGMGEGLLNEPIKIAFTKPVTGFASR